MTESEEKSFTQSSWQTPTKTRESLKTELQGLFDSILLKSLCREYWFKENMLWQWPACFSFPVCLPLTHLSTLFCVCQTSFRKNWIPSNIDESHCTPADLLIYISVFALISSSGSSEGTSTCRCTMNISILEQTQILHISKVHSHTKREEQIGGLYWQHCCQVQPCANMS